MRRRAQLAPFPGRAWRSAYSDDVRARVPASTANLGPGFDALALALDLYVEVEVEPSSRLVVRSEGEGAGLSDDAGHLAARVAMDVAGHDQLAITVRSQIPIARGLGSSAALSVAAAAAAGSPDPLAGAARMDGHAENAAASLGGGLVAATLVKGAVRSVQLALDPVLAFVVMVPDRPLPTTRARQVLPTRVSREDAAFNLGRMGLLLAGLADHNVLTKEATEDRLHQDYRSPLFPEAPMLLAALLEAGAKAVCWSGAGPSLLGICVESSARDVRDAASAAMGAHGVPGHALLLHADRRGMVTGETARLSMAPTIVSEEDVTRLAGDARPAPTPGGPLFDFDEDG